MVSVGNEDPARRIGKMTKRTQKPLCDNNHIFFADDLMPSVVGQVPAKHSGQREPDTFYGIPRHDVIRKMTKRTHYLLRRYDDYRYNVAPAVILIDALRIVRLSGDEGRSCWLNNFEHF